MYQVIELNTVLEDGTSFSARVGEEEDDIALSIDCQEMTPTKQDLMTLKRWLNAVIKEAK